MADGVEEFWRAFEKETGEKVEARSEGQWFRVLEDNTRPEGWGIWGLLILTDKSFRFRYVRETCESAMIRNAVVPFEPKDPAEFTVSREDIVSVCSMKRGFFKRFVRSGFSRCSVVARGKSGEKTYLFSADPSSGLIAALEKVVPCHAPEPSLT